VERGLKRLRGKYARKPPVTRPASVDERAWAIFTAYFHENLSLSEIAAGAGLAPSRVSRVLYEVDAQLEAALQTQGAAGAVLLDSPIEELALSSRAQNAIHRLGCAKVKDVLRLDLSAVRGIGRKTRGEVRAALRNSGLPQPELDECLDVEMQGLDSSLERMHRRIKAALDALAKEIVAIQKRIRKRIEPRDGGTTGGVFDA